jgi:hypothetical protein
MNYLYSLYDALVSINVPSDKARAVVDAMEHDMTAALATKQDIAQLRMHTDTQYALLRQEIETSRALTAQEFSAVRAEMARDLEVLRASMTIRLGSMLVVGLGVLFAALKLT